MKKISLPISRRQFLKITAITASSLLAGKLFSDLLTEESFHAVHETRVLMGTVINLTVISESKLAREQAISATFAELERQVAIFNHRDPNSPMAKLNHVGKIEKPPRELVEVLELAHKISAQTDGAFDVTVKPLVDLYQQTKPSLPDQDAIKSTLELVNYQNISISAAHIGVSRPNMAITLDGIAKGFIVDKSVMVLKNLDFSNVLVEAGGDLMTLGGKEPTSSWKIGLQAPRAKLGDLVAILNLQNQALATSGDYLQTFTSDFAHHHIINPHSGYSSPELASVSVTAPSAALADGLATAIMVMGRSGFDLIEKFPDCEAFGVAKDASILKSSGFQTI